jgi:hypothetical protein
MFAEFGAVNLAGGVAACHLVPRNRVRLGLPAADGGALVSSGHANRLGDSANSRVADAEDGVVHEMRIQCGR